MLGATTQNSGLYHGNGLDIPLRQWLDVNGLDSLSGLGWQLPRNEADGRGLGHAPMSSLPGEVGHATLPRNPERMAASLLPFDADAHFRSEAVSLQLAPPSPPSAPAPTEPERAARLQELYDYCKLDDVAIEPVEYIANRLTPAEAEAFERDGCAFRIVSHLAFFVHGARLTD